MNSPSAPVSLGVCYGKALSHEDNKRADISKVGGTAAFYTSVSLTTDHFLCGVCSLSDHVVLVAQIYAPIEVNRSLYIFACCKRTCSLKSKGWKVFRNQDRDSELMKATIETDLTPIKSFSTQPNSESVWEFLSAKETLTPMENSENSLDDLEALLNARDNAISTNSLSTIALQSGNKQSKSSKAFHSKNKVASSSAICLNSWPAWRVVEEYEPVDADTPSAQDDDRIRDMCRAYLDEEEDKAVAAVVARAMSAPTSAPRSILTEAASTVGPDDPKGIRRGGDTMEMEESDGDDDENSFLVSSSGIHVDDDFDDVKDCAARDVELTFQNACSLQPRQVLRYAYEGRPLWCTAPAPVEAHASVIPCCEYCGSARVFEVQLMPAILSLPLPKPQPSLAHNSAQNEISALKTYDESCLRYKLGEGLDFGVVAVWSCPNSCTPTMSQAQEQNAVTKTTDSSTNGLYAEYVVVQPPADFTC